MQNLNFLTTEQALEDVAKFVAFQKSLDKFKESMVRYMLFCKFSQLKLFYGFKPSGYSCGRFILSYYCNMDKTQIPSSYRHCLFIKSSPSSKNRFLWYATKFDSLLKKILFSYKYGNFCSLSEYLEAVNDAINQTDTTCLNIIQSGIQEIVNELNTPDGRKHIAELFRYVKGSDI